MFYVHQFLQEYLEEQERKNKVVVDEDDVATYIRNAQYTKDQQVYVDMPNMYPSIYFESKNATNSNIPEFSCGLNFRQKLCMKVMTRERDTDYFLTVYKKKELGNEKIYEKRINMGGKEIQNINKLEFQPGKGQYILLSFEKFTGKAFGEEEPEESQHDYGEESNDDDDEEESKEESAHDEGEEASKKTESNKEDEEHEDDGTENKSEGHESASHHSSHHERTDIPERKEVVITPWYTLDLIFNIEAQFKNPLFVKPKTTPLGFYGDKHFYSMQKDFVLPNG